MEEDIVELKLGFYYDCPDCKHRNWVEGCELSEEDVEGTPEELFEDFEEYTDFLENSHEFIAPPRFVRCEGCGKVAKTQVPGEDLPEADEAEEA